MAGASGRVVGRRGAAPSAIAMTGAAREAGAPPSARFHGGDVTAVMSDRARRCSKADARAHADCPCRARASIANAARTRGDALIVDVQVVPRASRAAVGPEVGDRLRVAVTAPPVDGAANAAVIEALAAAFGVRRAAVSILRGETGRRKTVRIEGEASLRLEALRAARDAPVTRVSGRGPAAIPARRRARWRWPR